jgi:hypothetical protein
LRLREGLHQRHRALFAVTVAGARDAYPVERGLAHVTEEVLRDDSEPL